MTDHPPFSSTYDLSQVRENGVDVALKPSAAERAQIAAWLGIESLETFQASVRLTRTASGRYLYRGHFDADVVQACVVTLEPVPSHVSGDFERSFQLAPPTAHLKRRGAPEPPPVIAITDLDDDSQEILKSPVVDLAAPMLEELSLALDPYPRKAGVSFVPPEDAGTAKDNPFSVLKNLKPD